MGNPPLLPDRLPIVEILGVPIARLTREEAVEAIDRLYQNAAPAMIVFANAHVLNLAYRDPAYKALLRRAALVLNDGIGVGLGAWLGRRPFPANLNGTDFTPCILSLAARQGWTVFLLGAKRGVAETAARRLRERTPRLNVVGWHDGYFRADEVAVVVDSIRRAGTDLLLVALGNPLQEFWLDRHLEATGARIGVAVGAFFDYSAGLVPRAPSWMNRFGIEWVYRLAHEPRRLWRRYLLGNVVFLARIAIERARGLLQQRDEPRGGRKPG